MCIVHYIITLSGTDNVRIIALLDGGTTRHRSLATATYLRTYAYQAAFFRALYQLYLF